MAVRISRSAREPSMNPLQPGTRWQAGTRRHSTEQFQQRLRCLLPLPVIQVPERNFHDSCCPPLPTSAFQHHVGASARWNLGQCQPSGKELGSCRVQLSGFHHSQGTLGGMRNGWKVNQWPGTHKERFGITQGLNKHIISVFDPQCGERSFLYMFWNSTMPSCIFSQIITFKSKNICGGRL